jgi:molybdopterin synthase sulfur carrier subunit
MLITIKLLGSIKKSVGQSDLQIEPSLHTTVNDILSFLQNNYKMKNQIKQSELMIAINGIESSIIGGNNAVVSSGDVVTILSVVHGG